MELKAECRLSFRYFILFAVLFIIAVALAGCDRTKSDWQKAQKTNTTESYQQFISNHPRAAQVEDAMSAIEGLAWNAAKNQNTMDAVNAFIEKYPSGWHVNEAKEVLEDLEWVDAKNKNTAAAYNAFLAKYKNGRYSTEAGSAAEAREWDEAKSSNSPSAFLAYYRSHADSARVTVSPGVVTSAIAYPMGGGLMMKTKGASERVRGSKGLGGGSPMLWIEINGIHVDMSPEEAGKLGIITFENDIITTRSGSMKANVIKDKATGKILSVDTGEKP